MSDFIDKYNPHLNIAQTLAFTYPRTIQISFGHYPYPDEINNLIVEVKSKITEKDSYASNVQGGKTAWKEFREHPLIIKFMQFCIRRHKDTTELFTDFDRIRMIDDAWGNEVKKGDYVKNHVHPTWTCILYLTKGAPLILPELNYKIDPQPGDYYFIPPFVYHCVPISEDENNRYNIVLNISDSPQKIKTWEMEKKINEKYFKSSS